MEVVKVLSPSACLLGEGPMWHVKRKSCFWVDIERCRIYEYDWQQGFTRQYDMKDKVSLVVSGKEDLIIGMQGGVFRFNTTEEKLSMITNLGVSWDTHRCNDGIVDSKGRLWISAMELKHLPQAADVYRVNKYGLSEKYIEAATIPNGMAWSNDGKRLYYIDSINQGVNAYLYDEETGTICFEKIAVLVPAQMGVPDGMTIDERGMLWVALWGGYGVGCFDVASGDLVSFIDIPAPYVTSCAFAGEDLDHLIITTAIADMKPEDLLKYPESGNTFVVKMGVSGIADHICIL